MNDDHDTDGRAEAHAPEPATNARGASSREVAHRNERLALQLVGYFGHLRTLDLATALYPGAEHKSAYEMARRTVRRLAGAGELLERRNAIGGVSYVLGRRGVSRLQQAGFDAKTGYEISSVAGGTFLHRTLTTCYLLKRMHEGAHPIGEYALLTGQTELEPLRLKAAYRKLPDGLCITTGHPAYPAGAQLVEWVETEFSYKPDDELDRVIALEGAIGPPLAGMSGSVFDRLTVLCDRASGHAERILARIPKWMSMHAGRFADRDAGFDSVFLALADIQAPMTVTGFAELCVGEELRRRGAWQPRLC